MSSKHKYALLESAAAVHPHEVNAHWWRRLRLTAYLIVPIITSIGSFLLGVHISESRSVCTEGAACWSAELAAMERRPVQFSGAFNFTNRYRAPPSDVLDEEWNRFTHHALIDGTASLIAVTANDIMKANLTADSRLFDSTVEYGQVNGGGHMATLEMFHQLHCLNMLRKAVHSDYYEKIGQAGSRSDKMATHLDHCIEILRQVITCYGDTGLITYHWVQGNPVPYPDFSTWHQCRDPEEMLAWAKEREAPIQVKVDKAFFPNVFELEEAP
ncbi:hypothetical protein LMH87_000853 [Akanthomyces muscarius]|uniref:Tat pathway signal sequence n=1 Tax=Akanthomyces muscarius TaxID=2231603 RepID=A0A9W8UP74_AKAMU|nr:hypothetical protein LMH87_000853 [Akanthomyces muscarius]KAJ4155616.1 hypothetical protein LMH87_000853 [Akanthomyces muscarius]